MDRRPLRPAVRGVLAAVLALCCGCVGAPPAALPADVGAPSPAEVGRVAGPEGAPAGEVRVGVPEDPPGWLPLRGAPAVAGDLAMLWGLPLYHLDAAGQPRPALLADAEVDDTGTRVVLELRAGRWSDGAPVGAEDLVATIAALQDRDAAEVAHVAGAEVVDERRALVQFERPTRTWPGLLGQVGVLPAHVLADGGLDAAGRLEVTGGPFRLAAHEPGLGARFEAHPDGPLGSPGLEAIEVVVVPSFDTALGLVDDGELDATVGHLAVRPAARVADLDRDDLEVAAPVGGTSVVLDWRRGRDPGPTAAALAATVDVGEQVEALDLGTTVTTPVPGHPEPGPEADAPAAPDLREVDAAVVLQREQEALSSTASLLEAQVRGREGRLRLERRPAPDDLVRADAVDGHLRVRRDGPFTPLAAWSAGDHPELADGDAAVRLGDPAGRAGLARLREDAAVTPLYRARVTHVHRRELVGLAPSAWPGAGFTSALRWRWASGD